MADGELKAGETLDPTEIKGTEVPQDQSAEDDGKSVGRGEEWTEKDVIAPVAAMMEMSKRIAEKRRQQEAEAAQKADAREPDAATPAASSAAESEPSTEPTAPETVKVKINHQEREVPKADVDAAGGIAAYQMTKAAEERLESAKRKEQELTRRLEEIERQMRAAPPAQAQAQPPQPAPAPEKSKAEAELEAAAEAFDTAVSEALEKEVIAAARKRWQEAQFAVQRELWQKDRDDLVRQAATTAKIGTEIESYNRRANATIAKYEADLKDDDVRVLSVANARRLLQNELEKATGVTVSEMAGISDPELERFHAQAMAQNPDVRDISAIWEDAITAAKTRLSPPTKAAPSVAPELAAREQRKASTPTSPSPSSVRAVSTDAPPPPQKPVSGFIERQNKMKGMA